MINPYVSRGPVRNAEMFFGRRQELNEITAFLRGNQSISIVGPRKIGKTSLLYHLMRASTRKEYQLENISRQWTYLSYQSRHLINLKSFCSTRMGKEKDHSLWTDMQPHLPYRKK